MTSFATTILQLALALLMSVQSNSATITDAMRTQAITVANSAIQIATQALNTNAGTSAPMQPVQTPTQPTQAAITISPGYSMGSYSWIPNSTSDPIGYYDLLSSGAPVDIKTITVQMGPNASQIFQNVKVIASVNSGYQLGMTQPTVADNGTYTFSGDLANVMPNGILPNGAPLSFHVEADILPNASGTSNTTILGCTGTNVVTNTPVSCGQIQVQGQTGSVSSQNSGTNQNFNLGVGMNSNFANPTYSVGSSQDKIASFVIIAPTDQSGSISSITLSETTLPLQNVGLFVNGVQVSGTTSSISVVNSVGLNINTPIQLSAGKNVVVDVVADVPNTVAPGTYSGLVSLTGVTGTLGFSGTIAGQNVTLTK